MKLGGFLLLFQEVYKLNITELAKVPVLPLLAEGFEVLDTSDVHVPCHAGVDGERKSRGSGLEFLLQPTFSLWLLRVKPRNRATW